MISFQLQHLSQASSTNDVVKRAIEEGAEEGFAVVADEQTAGYGRQGRTWASPKGGLYLSLLLRPKVEAYRLPTVSLVSALAVRRAVVSLVDERIARRIKIKWPNDIVVASPLGAPDGEPAYRKLAGISHEMHAGALCVGIGVNVARHCADADAAPVPAGANVPVYVCDLAGREAVGVADVARAVLSEYGRAYDEWASSATAISSLGEYVEHSFLTGRHVRIANIDGAVTCAGIVRGVDEYARLVIAGDDGEIHRVSSGEAHLV